MLFSRTKKEPTVLRKKTPKRHVTILQKQILIGVSIVLVCALVITVVYHLTRIDSLQISEVAVIGGETIPHNTIVSEVNDTLNGTYFKLVPKRFAPFYPQDAIVAHITENDRIKNVHVEVEQRKKLIVVFDEYTPYALSCATKETETCFFIDANGFAFAQAPELQGSAFVRYVEEGKESTLRSQVFETAFIRETASFIESLKDVLGLYVTTVTKQGTYDVSYTLSGGGTLKVSQTIPMQETFENLQTILSSETFVHIEPGSFQYIDLRFGDKVFLNEAPLQSASSTVGTSTAVAQ
jgi:hypothetical protein